jgi:hypothetical protein
LKLLSLLLAVTTLFSPNSIINQPLDASKQGINVVDGTNILIEPKLSTTGQIDGNNEAITAIIQRYFPENHQILTKIAFCESSFNVNAVNKNIKNGEVWSRDWGLFQINDHYHLDNANKMGLNILSAEGNVKYARYLYDSVAENKLRFWEASRPCWGR